MNSKKSVVAKTKNRSPEELKMLMNRLNKISGQINGIKKWWKKMRTAQTF